MRVLIVSEGKHELGDGSQPGALELLVRQLMKMDFSCDWRKVSSNVSRLHGKGNGYYKRALRWMMEAHRCGYYALVLVIDEDGLSERVTQITTSQSDTRISSIPRALGVAIREFDAWMLADETALTQVLDREISRQKDAEKIKDSKKVFAQLLKDSNRDLAMNRLYSRIASVLKLSLLEERCPHGFAPFATRVRGLRDALPESA